MSYKDIFNQRNSAYGSTIREIDINTIKYQVTSYFHDNPSYYQVQCYTASTPLSATPLDAWITDDPNKVEEVKQIQLIPDIQLNYGDLIYWTTSDGLSDYWLTTTVDYMGGIYYRGSMQKCLSSLKWQDSTGTIKEAYLIETKDAQRGLGILDGKEIILPNERRFIAIQSNVDTRKIVKGQRFIFDGDRCFRVVSLSTLKAGLIQLEMEEQLLDTVNDNVNLRICGYVTPTVNPTATLYVSSTTSPIDQIKVTSNKTYQSLVDGALVDVTWSLFSEDQTTTTTLATIYSFTSNSCLLKADSSAGGIVWLKAVLTSDVSKIAWQEISLVGLI